MFWKASVLEKTEENKDFPFIAKLKVIPGKPSVLFYKKQNRRKTVQKEIKGPWSGPKQQEQLGTP